MFHILLIKRKCIKHFPPPGGHGSVGRGVQLRGRDEGSGQHRHVLVRGSDRQDLRPPGRQARQAGLLHGEDRGRHDEVKHFHFFEYKYSN